MSAPVLLRDRSPVAQVILGGVVPAAVGVLAGVLVRRGRDPAVVAGDRGQGALGELTGAVSEHLHVEHQVEPQHGEQEPCSGGHECGHTGEYAVAVRPTATRNRSGRGEQARVGGGDPVDPEPAE